QVPPQAIAAHVAWAKGQKEELKAMYSKQAEQELLQTVREFHTCKQTEGQSVSSHVLKMKGYIENLERLGQPVRKNLAKGFRKTRKINRTKLLGGHGKGKGKMGNALFATKPKTPPPPKKDNPAKDAVCHQCGEVGHWRRNCPVYLAELMKKNRELALQGLRGSKKLKPGALSLYVGDGHRTAVEAIGTYHLELPSGLVIVLNNCHYAPSITRDVISVSRLFDDGFVNRFDENNVISVSKNNLVYFMAVPRDVERAKDLLGLIHTDVCGPFKIVSIQGASYFVTFTDDFSRYDYVYLLKHKHEVFETFKVFQKEVENQLGKTIKSLCSDRGGEYMSQEFLDHLKEHGIIAYRTPLYTSQNNEVSERRNRTLLDMVRSMMSQTTLPNSFCDYALETAARILNMVPTKKRDTLTKPDKLDPRSFKCIFVGYPKETMRYSFYRPSENKDDQEIDEPQSDINPIHKSSRTRRASDHMCLYIDVKEHELGDLGEPANYKAALLDPESKKWLNAMNVEMKSMKDNDVWVLVELPPNARIVGSKCLFKKKTDMDGAVYVFKARLVAKGFTQTYGVDYEETFSPVADIRAIRILIAIAAYYDYEIWQMDVKTAFLNGHLSKEVYMEQLEGFVNPKYP
nr:hypothetical protein [Tanacetum cinerariifolium]